MADVEWALEHGRDAEQEVQRELKRLAPEFGFHHLTRLLIEFPWGTSQLDHVLVDRYGVLIIETKRRQGATLYGSDVEKRWTAFYRKSEKKYPFENPLLQNQEHENALRQALERRHPELEPDYVDSAVLFVGAQLHRLKLRDRYKRRVVCVERVEEFLRDRSNFPPNPGQLSRLQILDLLVTLCELDQSGQPRVARRHEEYLRARFKEAS